MKTHYSRITLGTLVSAICLSMATPAFAQFAKPEDAVKYRQSAFALMGAHMGRLAGHLEFDSLALHTLTNT